MHTHKKKILSEHLNTDPKLKSPKVLMLSHFMYILTPNSAFGKLWLHGVFFSWYRFSAGNDSGVHYLHGEHFYNATAAKASKTRDYELIDSIPGQVMCVPANQWGERGC